MKGIIKNTHPYHFKNGHRSYSFDEGPCWLYNGYWVIAPDHYEAIQLFERWTKLKAFD
jgi:hypothetical protein